MKRSVSELLDIFRVAIAEKGIQLHYVCSERMPEEVVTDAQRINQVLINLMQNAVKFTMQGSITVEMDYETSIDMLRVTVRDTGIGIKNEDKGKLFKMFGKLEDTAVINTTGIGLGLSICKQIVQVFNGTIQLDETDVGSSFSFTIMCQKLDENSNDLLLDGRPLLPVNASLQDNTNLEDKDLQNIRCSVVKE